MEKCLTETLQNFENSVSNILVVIV